MKQMWIIIISVLVIYLYGGNVYRLTQCDFIGSGNFKGEFIHTVGLVLPTFLFTAHRCFDEQIKEKV